MGLRGSKAKKNSYDVAPVVSKEDFTYEKVSSVTEGVKLDVTVVEESGNGVDEVKVTEVVVVEEVEEINVTPDVAVNNVVPEWLTEKLFLDTLKENVEGFVRIKDLKAKPAMSAGENYATLMLRVSVEVEVKDNKTKKLSYMLKLPHDTPKMKQMLEFSNFFNTENLFYFDILPQLEQAYKAKGVEINFGAKAYRLTNDEHALNTVLLEDLGQYGFKNANRLECLNEQHTKCVLKKMAQFHAASAYIFATKGPFAETFMRGMISKDKPYARDIVKSMIGSFEAMFLANLHQYEDGESYYKPKFEKMFNNMFELILEITEYNQNDFGVINHGDSWSNNILFKYDDEQNVSDVYFVDFQQPRFGSPAQDLLYFIISSVNIDIKLKKFDYLIHYYHENLIEQLKLLGYPNRLPTLKEIHMEIIKHSAWSIMTTVITLPIVLADSSNSATMDNFMSEDEAALHFKKSLYVNKRYRNYVKELLPWLDNRGFLES